MNVQTIQYLRSRLRRSRHLKALLNLIARQRSVQQPRDRGFTLTEVLVAALIGSLIVSGLLGVMVELLTSDAREAARNETQREMQLALDYISTDLREAVYVYDGDCMAGVVSEGSEADPEKVEANCSRLFENGHVSVPANSTPVLAFWKLDELPDRVKENCVNADLDQDDAPPCISGRSYSLVVYYLTRNDDNSIWSGKARIQRYEFARYNSSGVENTNYVSPAESGFDSWPLVNETADGGANNLSGLTTLVDFVDSRPMSEIPELVEAGGASVRCPTGYALTPSDTTLGSYGFTDVRNFYACIRVPDSLRLRDDNLGSDEVTSFNQKVILFVRGNAEGKPGIDNANEGFMPAIETQVLNRGVTNKVPKSQ